MMLFYKIPALKLVKPFFVAAVLGACAVTVQPLYVPSAVYARSGPDSFADLAANVVDAVVNISATQVIIDKRPQFSEETPDFPRGTPFDDFFDEFFKNRRGGNGAPSRHKASSLGSGFVIDSSGIIVTNNHVIEGASDIEVIFTDGSKLKAELLGRDPKVDIALLRVKPEKPLKAVKFGDSDKMRVGDWVMAVGNPFGLGGTVTAGIVSARNRNIESGPYDNYIQTDASINRGNSGGPLFNMDGDVIGINTAILSPTGGSVGIGFATPSNLATPVIDQLRQYGETRRGWLGVRVQNVDDTIAESLGLGKARGALIADVEADGPSKPAGIEPGDVIVKFDGKDIVEARDLSKYAANTPVGKSVEVVLVRKGVEMTKTVKLGRLEDGEKQASHAFGNDNGDSANPKKVLGLQLSPLNDLMRNRFGLKNGQKGLVVLSVDPESAAAGKIEAGSVIVEVNQTPVVSIVDLNAAVEAARKQGKKSVLLSVASPSGDQHFVALNVN